MYISDTGGPAIKVLSSATGKVSLLAGQIGNPGYMTGAYLTSRYFQALLSIHALRHLLTHSFEPPLNEFTLYQPSYKPDPLISPRYHTPRGIVVDSSGVIYVSDYVSLDIWCGIAMMRRMLTSM